MTYKGPALDPGVAAMHVMEVYWGEAILCYKDIAALARAFIAPDDEPYKHTKSSTMLASNNRTDPSLQEASRQRDGIGCQHAREVASQSGGSLGK